MNAPYDPGMGQIMFGNKWQEHSADDFGDDLYELSKQLGLRNEEAQHHGILGGQYGYGQDFKNEVFEMHPYYWGDCECGFEELEEQWSGAHQHADDCYQSALKQCKQIAGLWIDWNGDIQAQQRKVDKRYKNYEAQNRAQERIYRNLCKEYGMTYPSGCAVHCTCDHDRLFTEWRDENDHKPDCRVVLPNFRHYASGLEINWYKYIGRGMSANKDMSLEEFKVIVSECIGTLDGNR